MASAREGSDDEVRDVALLPEPPRGPLQVARARASFPWRELALFWEGEDTLRFKNTVFSALENDPLFSPPRGGGLPVEKYQEVNFLRCKRVLEYSFLRGEDLLWSPQRITSLLHCLGAYDWSLANMLILHLLEFIIHSPDFEAAKFWVGNMGKVATHAVVFAQLYTPGGQCHGIHPFIVQIRDPKTLLPMPGVMVGDVGRKLGQNGLGNGFAMFHQVRIPRQDLLNHTADVTPEGTYVPKLKDARQRFGRALGSLSTSRVFIVALTIINLKLALSIALRFSATRRQFGPADGEEVPVLEYQTQQWRLLPYLAATWALDHFSRCLFLALRELQLGFLKNDRSARQAELGREVHALSSAGKPLASWTAQRGIQECREACGGHGYLAVNRLGDLRDDNDPNCTYEGDNNLLLQQTSNYLLSLWERRSQGGGRIESPLETVDFLDACPDILGQRFEGCSPEDFLDSSVPLAAYKWLVCYLLRESYQKFSREKQSGSSDFEARNNSQVYYCRSLALAYLELTVVRMFHQFTHQPHVPPPLQPVLRRLSALYALWSLNQHTALLYRGGYFSGEQAGKMVENAILTLCAQLKDDSVALVDVMAPPDFILDSPIGRANGELYKNLWGAVLQGSKVLERASWWSDFVNKPVIGGLKSNL
uniref:Acyl-coenzyme A oxidase n=1 Tax=Sus scrofa TaxID=9823 RepID=A0A8D1WKJ3_PIG